MQISWLLWLIKKKYIDQHTRLGSLNVRRGVDSLDDVILDDSTSYSLIISNITSLFYAI